MSLRDLNKDMLITLIETINLDRQNDVIKALKRLNRCNRRADKIEHATCYVKDCPSMAIMREDRERVPIFCWFMYECHICRTNVCSNHERVINKKVYCRNCFDQASIPSAIIIEVPLKLINTADGDNAYSIVALNIDT